MTEEQRARRNFLQNEAYRRWRLENPSTFNRHAPRPKSPPLEIPTLTEAEWLRFWSKVDKTETCWLWVGAGKRKGYGRFSVTRDHKKRDFTAHRLVWASIHGTAPSGELVLDHICEVRACVNPAHLQVITHVANVLKGGGVTGINHRKTHCLRGHALEGENLHIDRGMRKCRACILIRKPRYGPEPAQSALAWKSALGNAGEGGKDDSRA